MIVAHSSMACAFFLMLGSFCAPARLASLLAFVVAFLALYDI